MSRLGADNSNRELSIFYVCDCSGSMAGNRIAAINAVLPRVLSDVAEFAEQVPDLSVSVGAIRFSGEASWHIQPNSPIRHAVWTPIVDTGGVTALGQAYLLLAAYLKTIESRQGQLPPVIVLLSDGMPTDDAGSALRTLLAGSIGKVSTRFAIGIGDEVDQDSLSELVGRRKECIALANSAMDIKQWVADFTLNGMRAALPQVVACHE